MVVDAYRGLVSKGILSVDENQKGAVHLLDELGTALLALEKGNNGLAGFFKNRKAVPKGLYLWGDVGRGKTLLMDLFFEEIAIKAKRRVHFHEFMDEMHAAIAQYRRSDESKKGARDPIPHIIKPVIKDVRLLCFDEFHVTDITNAMLLQRLFEKLFHAGLVVVATSNVPPEKLYENGLNRQLFLPFIDLLHQHTKILQINGAHDYRGEKLSGGEIFHFGTGQKANKAMDAIFLRLTGGQKAISGALEILGRTIKVPAEAMGVARFSFAELCEVPLGSRDYLKIARTYHTLVIDNIPQFDDASPSAAKRFILLIDSLYDSGVKLAAGFAVKLDDLSNDKTTAFEFKRTISRLKEMRSDDYISAPRKQVQTENN